MATSLNLKNLSDDELKTLMKAHGIDFGVLGPSNFTGPNGQAGAMTDLGTPRDGRTLLGSTMGQLEAGYSPNPTFRDHFGYDKVQSDVAKAKQNIGNQFMSPYGGQTIENGQLVNMDQSAVMSRQTDKQVMQQMQAGTEGPAGDMGGNNVGLSPINSANGSSAYDQYRLTQGSGGPSLEDYLPQSMRSRYGETGSPLGTTYGKDVYNMSLDGTLPNAPTSFGPNGMPQGPGWDRYQPGVGIGQPGGRAPATLAGVPDYRVPGTGVEANIGAGQHPLQQRYDVAPNSQGIDFTAARSAREPGDVQVSPNLFRRQDGSTYTAGTRRPNINLNDMVYAEAGPNDSPDMLQTKHNLNNQSRQDYWASKLGLDPAVENYYFNNRADQRDARMQQMGIKFDPNYGRPSPAESKVASSGQITTSQLPNGTSTSYSRPWTAQEQAMLDTGDTQGALASFRQEARAATGKGQGNQKK